MKQGNERFRNGGESAPNYIAQQRATANDQHPAAIILSCIDSRAPAEIIMDFGIGDVFNSRVAGNISNDDIVGSMEFACKAAGAKVVLVMGHTSCGAMAQGAIAGVKLGSLRNCSRRSVRRLRQPSFTVIIRPRIRLLSTLWQLRMWS